jgi:hypothetical protein
LGIETRMPRVALLLLAACCRLALGENETDTSAFSGGFERTRLTGFLRWNDGSAAQPPFSIRTLAASLLHAPNPWTVREHHAHHGTNEYRH